MELTTLPLEATSDDSTDRCCDSRSKNRWSASLVGATGATNLDRLQNDSPASRRCPAVERAYVAFAPRPPAWKLSSRLRERDQVFLGRVDQRIFSWVNEPAGQGQP